MPRHRRRLSAPARGRAVHRRIDEALGGLRVATASGQDAPGEFGRHAAANRKGRGLGKPEVFNFLGFTHICGRSRKGHFQLRRQSRRDRLRVKLREIRESLWQHRHAPIEEQGSWLRQVMTGWFAYHAVPVNGPSLHIFREAVIRHWRRALRRRGQLRQDQHRLPTARFRPQ